MANLYSPESLGITPPKTGFQQGGWYSGRQYWGGQLSDPGVINPLSVQPGAGQAVSPQVNVQSAQQQGIPASQFESYIQQQRDIQAKRQVQPAQQVQPAPQAQPTQTTGATGVAGAGAGTGLLTQPAINLPDIYKNLYSSSGITNVESELSEKTKAYNETVAKIKDNPYLSEGTMTGRIKKIDEKFNADIAGLKNDIAMKKADIETKLNLQMKQFDINSQQAKMALDQFNSLLSAGALSGASGEDIANITRATGISSSMIQSAIASYKEKNKKEVKTEIKTFTNENTGVVTSVVINSDTGEIINQQNLGAIGATYKPTAVEEPKKMTQGEQSAAVEAIISSYIGNKQQQAMISPEDLYRELLAKYPESIEFIKKYWSPANIRKATQGKIQPK